MYGVRVDELPSATQQIDTVTVEVGLDAVDLAPNDVVPAVHEVLHEDVALDKVVHTVQPA